MDVRIRQTFLPCTDPEAAVRFYRDGLGLEVVDDVGAGAMRWLTLRSTTAPDVCLTLEPVGAGLSVTDNEPDALLADRCRAHITFVTDDLDAVFETLVSLGAEPLQEPMLREFGGRDCVFLDPAGTVVRIEVRVGETAT